MSRTSQTETVKEKVTDAVWVAKPSRLDRPGRVGAVRDRDGSVHAYLKVVAYPWGVEFEQSEEENDQ